MTTHRCPNCGNLGHEVNDGMGGTVACSSTNCRVMTFTDEDF